VVQRGCLFLLAKSERNLGSGVFADGHRPIDRPVEVHTCRRVQRQRQRRAQREGQNKTAKIANAQRTIILPSSTFDDIMIRRFSSRLLWTQRRHGQLSFAYEEDDADYYYENSSENDDDDTSSNGTVSASTTFDTLARHPSPSSSTMTRKPLKMVRFFLSHNQSYDDPRTTSTTGTGAEDEPEPDSGDGRLVVLYNPDEWWYSSQETADFRRQFNRERKWLMSLDAIVDVVGQGHHHRRRPTTTTTTSFGSLMVNIYGSILKRNGLYGRQKTLDIHKSHCRQLALWLEADHGGTSRAGLEKLLVPLVLHELLFGRKLHRDAVLRGCALASSTDRLREISADLSVCDQILAHTTAVALARVVVGSSSTKRSNNTGVLRRLVRPPNRVVR
jgi:hypothetical protein